MRIPIPNLVWFENKAYKIDSKTTDGGFIIELLETIPKDYSDYVKIKLESSTPIYLDELIKTPTQEEVCKALSDFYNSILPHLKEQRIEYQKDKNRFILYIDNKDQFGTWICYLNQITKRLIFTQMLPPYLITIIGKFYEGENYNE